MRDVTIIGGGINGAGLFRDLALHGLDVLLLEKGDFSSQTSQGSSKMLHGGIRYLENFDFALVQEALEEKNLWLKLAPHICSEKKFFLPVYAWSKWPLPFVRSGIFLYDALSHFQNKPGSSVGKEKLLAFFPTLNPVQLKGAGTYYDGIVDDHKLALECIWDGEIEDKAQALNYQEVIAIESHPHHSTIIYQDRLNGKTSKVSTKFIIYATGPFTDELLKKWKIPWNPALLPSKGIHLWIKEDSLKLQGPLVLQTKDNRVIFVIPQRGAILVGTTETPVEEEMFNIQATHKEIDYLLKVLNDYFPSANVTQNDIINTFAAIRPLVKEAGAQDRGKTSRYHRIFRPTHHSYVLLGGKYTTFRRMAQDVCRELIPRLGLAYKDHLTLNRLRRISTVPTFTSSTEANPLNLDTTTIKKIITNEKVRTYEDLTYRRLSWIKTPESYDEIQGIQRKDIEKIIQDCSKF
jgi:glycerol-3-phosphate dehydrogenase